MGPTIITTAIAVLLGSIKMDSCLYFNYTGKNQPIAQNINSSLSIYRNSTACCNCASPNIFHSTNVPSALPSEIFIHGDCAWGGTPGSIHESIQKGREGVDKLRQDGEWGWINNFLGGFGLGRWAMHLLKLLTVSLLIFLCILIHVPENDRPLYLGNIKKHTRLIKFRFVLHIGVRTSQSATTAPCPGSLEPTGAGESMPGLAGAVAPQCGANPFPFSTFGVSTMPRGSQPPPTAHQQGCGGAGPPPGHRAPPGWPLHRGGSRCPRSAPSQFSSSSSRSFSCSASPPSSPSRPSCRSISLPGSLGREAKP